MASVAICPHCYLQLMVPDDIQRDALVECPTCAKEFDLGQAVLREIPAVVRVERARIAESEAMQVAAQVEAEVAADSIQHVQEKIAAEISAHGFHAGVTELLLEEPPEPERLADTVRRPDTEVRAWLKQIESVPELPPQDLAEERSSTTEASADEMSVAVEEVVEILESIEAAEDKPVPAPSPSASRPGAVTLADLLPPSPTSDEPPPGPSFELPNVPLTADLGATIEIESSMSFGPVAETEFELDDVDFEPMSSEENAAIEPEPVYDEPELRRPAADPDSAVPFVLPSVPRTRKKRSVARTLVGFASSSVVGLSLGYLVLLYVLGPDGDLLHVAKYLPSAVLPKAFQQPPATIAESTQPPSANEAVAETQPVEQPSDQPTQPPVESENVPAGYVEDQPADSSPTTDDSTDTDDRYAPTTAPASLEEPAAAPIASATPPLPIQGPTYSIDQLRTALDAGEQAKQGLVTGDLSDAAVRRTKGMSYAKLCDLAHAVVFLDRSSNSSESEELEQQARQLFGGILADTRVRDEVNRIASIWIDSPHRRHGGVFLAGKVSGGQIAGDVYEYQLATPDGGSLALLMSEPLDPLADGTSSPLGFVGTIVDEPEVQVAGYHGDSARAIWVENAIPLD